MSNRSLREGDRVRVTFPEPSPGWMSGEVLQVNVRKQRALVRWDADRMTDLVPLDRITVLKKQAGDWPMPKPPPYPADDEGQP